MSKRWDDNQPWGIENPIEVPRADEFLADIEAVCRKHGLVISHEDCHGSFEIVPLDDLHLAWLKDATWRVP
jgi:hypothetical protein